MIARDAGRATWPQRIAEGWRNRCAVLRTCPLAGCAREIGSYWATENARGTTGIIAMLLVLPCLGLAVAWLVETKRMPGLAQPWIDLVNEHHVIGPLIVFILGLLFIRLEYLLLKVLVRASLRVVLFPIQLPMEFFRELRAGWELFLRCQAELSAWLDGPAIRGLYEQTAAAFGVLGWKSPIGQDAFLQNVVDCLDREHAAVLPEFALQELMARRHNPGALAILYRAVILRGDHFAALLPGLMARGFFDDPAQMDALSETLAELDAPHLAQALASVQAQDPDCRERAITHLFQAAQQLDDFAVHAFTAALTLSPRPVLRAALDGLK